MRNCWKDDGGRARTRTVGLGQVDAWRRPVAAARDGRSVTLVGTSRPLGRGARRVLGRSRPSSSPGSPCHVAATPLGGFFSGSLLVSDARPARRPLALGIRVAGGPGLLVMPARALRCRRGSVRGLLSDHLSPGLTAVFVGTSVAKISAERGHYYSNPQNRFWELLAATGLLGGDRLGPEDDHRVRDYGIGLTDVVKHRAESSDARLRQEDFGAGAFVDKILLCQPEVVAFNGEKAGTVVARHLRQPPMRVNGRRVEDRRVPRLPAAVELAGRRDDRRGGQDGGVGRVRRVGPRARRLERRGLHPRRSRPAKSTTTGWASRRVICFRRLERGRAAAFAGTQQSGRGRSGQSLLVRSSSVRRTMRDARYPRNARAAFDRLLDFGVGQIEVVLPGRAVVAHLPGSGVLPSSLKVPV